MFGLTPYERKNSAMTYDPFKAFENFEREFFKTNGLAEFKTDIRDNGKEYELEADLPGFKKEDINIELDDTYLTIPKKRTRRATMCGVNVLTVPSAGALT